MQSASATLARNSCILHASEAICALIYRTRVSLSRARTRMVTGRRRAAPSRQTRGLRQLQGQDALGPDRASACSVGVRQRHDGARALRDVTGMSRQGPPEKERVGGAGGDAPRNLTLVQTRPFSSFASKQRCNAPHLHVGGSSGQTATLLEHSPSVRDFCREWRRAW